MDALYNKWGEPECAPLLLLIREHRCSYMYIVCVFVFVCIRDMSSTCSIYRIISQIRPPPPPPPPIVLMKTTAQVLLSVKILTVTNNLCDVYKILYYAAVYVRGHFCQHVIIRVSYPQSLYSIVVHGYAVHSVLASYNYYSACSVYV